MTAERDGKSRRTGQPDLLASLPDERPPASQPAPGIDPASIEELLTEVRDLREQLAGLRQLDSADRPAPVPAALTPEALEAWGDKLVTRVAEAARTADAPGDEAAATRIKRIEDAAARAAAAAERIDGGLEGTAVRVTAEVGAAATRIEAGFRITRDHVDRNSRLVHRAVEELRTRVAGRRFGFRDGSCGLDRLGLWHVGREPRAFAPAMAVGRLSRRRSPSLPLPRTGVAVREA